MNCPYQIEIPEHQDKETHPYNPLPRGDSTIPLLGGVGGGLSTNKFND